MKSRDVAHGGRTPPSGRGAAALPGPLDVAWKDHPAREELRAIYAQVDALLSPYTCDASGECCDFANTGREPYPTRVELEEALYAARAVGALSGKRASEKGAPSGRRRGRSLSVVHERRCALLSADGRCRIYASRPFGCRTFFCERMVGPGRLPRDEVMRLARSIADLAQRFDPRDPLPRPLSRALERAEAGG